MTPLKAEHVTCPASGRRGMIIELHRSVILIATGFNPWKEREKMRTHFGVIFDGEAENRDKTQTLD